MVQKKINSQLRIFLLLLSILMVACTGYRHGNFNAQKFTKLKTINNSEENQDETNKLASVPVESNFSVQPSDHNTDNKFNDGIIYQNTVEDIKPFNEIEPENIFNLPESNLEIEEGEKPSEVLIGHPRNFEKLSEDDKRQAIIDFNRIF